MKNLIVKERCDVKQEDRWAVEALYAGWKEWEEDFDKWARPGRAVRWPELDPQKFDLYNSKEIKKLLDVFMEASRYLTKLYTYAHLRHDEDVAEDRAKQGYVAAVASLHAFQEAVSWIEPTILQMPSEQLELLIHSQDLSEYKIYLEKMVRLKQHTLSTSEEKLLALASQATESAQRAFGALNNADLKFPEIVSGDGSKKELTHGTYSLYMRGQDRVLRKAAFTRLHESFLSFENTFCELIHGQIQKHAFEAKARGYASCLDAALFPYQIDPVVYRSLVETVKAKNSYLHRYVRLRKKLLGYDKLHFYDMQVPIVEEVDMNMSYTEAEKLVVASVGVLGKEYQEILQKGFTVERWVDRYENKRKRSGAYSSGCYDSHPYILMNYHGTFQDVTTLAHEAGHSMHSYYSTRHQPYHYSQYPIFLAEVASTFHEELLFHYLLDRTKDQKQKAFLINQKIDDIRGTLFRQTMFAEFELSLHEWVEKGVPLTPGFLKEKYACLHGEYYGSDLELDPEVCIEWARIPHFYYNFYVYQYATGISAAHALVEKVLQEGGLAQQRYLEFLSSGCSLYPIDTLARAGVDMRTSAPVEALLAYFNRLVSDLEQILS